LFYQLGPQWHLTFIISKNTKITFYDPFFLTRRTLCYAGPKLHVVFGAKKHTFLLRFLTLFVGFNLKISSIMYLAMIFAGCFLMVTT